MKPKVRFKGFEEDWKENPLGEMGSFSRGQGYSKKDLTDKGKPIFLYGRLYTKYNTFVSDIDTFALEQPNSILSKGIEVVMPSSGETAEDIAIASSIKKEDIILSGGLNIIIPDKDYLNADFLALNLSYGKPHYDLAKRAQGKSVVHLYNSDISSVDLTFPNDLGEQKAIGEYFRKLDGLIRDTGKEIEKLENLKQASLQKMFPQPGESVPQLRFKGFSEPWQEKRLGDLGEFRSNGVDKLSHPDEIQINLLNYMDVYNKRFITPKNCKELMQVTAKINQLKDCNIQKGDVFFTPSSETAEDIGHVMVIEYDLPKTCYSYHLMRFRPFENQFYINFPNYSFESKLVRKQLILEAQGVQRFVLSKGSFENIIVSIPSLEEQKAIGEYFLNLDNIISAKKKKLEKLRQVKSSCLNLMFV